jgi:protein kinase C substrate 80K-H
MKCLRRSHFESWNPSPDVQPGSPEYYSKQVYKHGARCWNGPERNVIVSFDLNSLPVNTEIAYHHPFHQIVLTCGTENAIKSVQELEKCEYQFTGTTPALCLPVTESNTNNKSKEEL